MKMQRGVCFVIFCLLTAGVGIATAQEAAAPVVATPLVGSLHVLRCNDNVQMLASIGEDGLLLVDTGYGATADAARDILTKLGGGAVKIVINTHSDGDHVGGNAVLGKGAVVVSHPSTLERMSTYYSLPAIPAVGAPNFTITAESTLLFNDDVIEILPFPGGHTDGDLVLHFTRSKVVFLGDIVLSGTFPNSDPARGGNAQRLAEVIATLIDTMPPDAIFVAAHGESLTMAELRSYLEMVEATIASVKAEFDAGHDIGTTLAARPLADWAKWEDAEVGLSIDQWTSEVYASFGGSATTSICAPLTEAMIADGIDAAVQLYRRLRSSGADGWDFGEGQLNMLGYQLLQRAMVDEAIKIFELNIESYPESANPYDSLGEAYMAAGLSDLAITNYQRSLELDPGNSNAVGMLERLRGD